MSITITPQAGPPTQPGTITQITGVQSAHGSAMLFALCADGSLWRLGDPFHHGVMEWTEISPPPTSRLLEGGK